MNGYLYRHDLELIMKLALGSGLLAAGIVFVAGVLFGWAYGLLIGFVLLLAVNLAGRR